MSCVLVRERSILPDLYQEIEPYESGFLEVDGGNRVYWEACGNPHGKPALVVHGGPGSGCTPRQRRLFDPAAYRIILFDQRNCGRSTPNASEYTTDLSHNTTAHLVADMERLRQHLAVDRWLILGGSWGSTLSLAYATKYPQRVSELLLFGVTTGRHSEIDWLFRGGVAIFFPEECARLRDALPTPIPDAEVVNAYYRLLNDPHQVVRQHAADAWCLWESATPDYPPSTTLSPRFANPDFARSFARLVTHYIAHNLFLPDGVLLTRAADVLANTPAILVNGRLDFQSPLTNAWVLHQALPRSELVVVDNAGHSSSNSGITDALIRATDSFR